MQRRPEGFITSLRLERLCVQEMESVGSGNSCDQLNREDRQHRLVGRCPDGEMGLGRASFGTAP